MSAVTVRLLTDALDQVVRGSASRRVRMVAAEVWGKAPAPVRWGALAVLMWRHRRQVPPWRVVSQAQALDVWTGRWR